MKLLVLGGTVFVGRALVEEALRRGHEVTLFNRGTRAGLIPGVEEIHGDRTLDLSGLEGRSWDWVVDTSGYLPRVVRMAAKQLCRQSPHYLFISTISVYSDNDQVGIHEESPIGKLEQETEEITGETYGPLKGICEREVLAEYPEALIIRPGLIIGPHDPTDRFTYWVMRAAQGGNIVVPKRLDQATQYIDVRDLASWALTMVEKGATGTYNAVGPEQPDTLGGLIEACCRAMAADAHLVPLSEDLLLEKEVVPFKDLPFWIPAKDRGDGLMQVDNSRARAEGLIFRPLDQSVRDIHQWRAGLDQPLKVGLTRERERELLASASDSESA